MEPEQGPAGSAGHEVGVCYLTATRGAGVDVSTLRVRIEFTGDVTADQPTTRYAVGPDAATEIVREWMSAMCAGR